MRLSLRYFGMFNENLIPTGSTDHFRSLFNQFMTVSSEQAEGYLNGRDSRGGTARLSALELLLALTYHRLHGTGALSSNVKRISQVCMSDAGLYQTRQRVGIQSLEQFSQHCLKVLSDRPQEPFSFYQNRLLVAIDGTTFQLKNTKELNGKFDKSMSAHRKDEPGEEVAFARLNVSCLVELGLHNPLAVDVGVAGESEIALGYKLVGRIPKDCMFLADRLYGNACYVSLLLDHFVDGDGGFLVRVGSSTTKERVVKTLSDGSTLIEVPLRNRKRPATIDRTILVREIRAELTTRTGKLVQLRFWTNLTDPKQNPAAELVGLYAKRWEHELYLGEIKNELMGGSLLQSKTLLCAVQEIFIAFWSSALIAMVRGAANRELSTDEPLALRISFRKALDKMQTIWGFIALVPDLITEELIQSAIRKAFEELKEETIPKRRQRSCPRTIRKKVSHWPKTRAYLAKYGPVNLRIIKYK